MTVERTAIRPPGHRLVPLFFEPDLGHYDEFRRFLAAEFGLDDDPLGSPGLLAVDGRTYALVFTGRSGEPFPAGVEVGALVDGLEPLDVEQADRDLFEIARWLVAGVGPPWTVDALEQTASIFAIAAGAGVDPPPPR